MSKTNTQERTIRSHENLVMITIKEQCGTLSKAILEGVMNSIDAKSTIIDVTIQSDKVVIIDNGRGFKSEESIKEVFECLGLPHERDAEGYSVDAEFGTFRIGRGQLFAFGKNRWRTNTFEMLTDIDNRGLKYTLNTGLTNSPGCTVEVELYQSLNIREISEAVEAVVRAAKYIRHDLRINGKKVSVSAANKKWHYEDELAYIDFKSSEDYRKDHGLDVYQQGIFVETIQARIYGLEGTIVIKDKVKLNTARNEILRNCPRWRKITEVLKSLGITRAKRNGRLNSYEAANMLGRLGHGELDASEVYKLSCFQLTNGKFVSLDHIDVKIKYKHHGRGTPMNPKGSDLIVSFDRAGSKVADRIMQMNRAMVFDDSVIDNLGCENEKQALAKIQKGLDHAKLVYVPMEKLGADISGDRFDLVDLKKCTPKEKLILNAAETVLRTLDVWMNGWSNRQARTLWVGISDTADGWTDGKSYIAIDRKFLNRLRTDQERGWVALTQLLLHELCHDGPDQATHKHGFEFYERYHDQSRSIPDAARNGYVQFCALMHRQMKRQPEAIVREYHKAVELQAAVEVMVKNYGEGFESLPKTRKKAKS